MSLGTAPTWLSELAGGQERAALRVGWLTVAPNPFITFFREGMAELRHRENVDFVLVESDAGGQMDSLPEAAARLVKSEVSIIVAVGTPPALAAWNLTHSIPIVTLSGDPVRYGMAESFAHPGGNVTGMGILMLDIAPKWVEILHELVPSVMTVAVLVDTSTTSPIQLGLLEPAARALGKRLLRLEIDGPGDIEPMVASARASGAGAMIAVSSPLFHAYKERLIAAAAEHRLPTIYEHSDFSKNGGLVSYGPDLRAVYRRLAWYVDNIASGTQPGDLPFEQPTKIELILNFATARALGLTIPPALLARADEVIE